MSSAGDWDAFVSEPVEEPAAAASEDEVLALTVRLALLEDIARLVTMGSDLTMLLHQILALCESVVQAEAASMLLVDERSGGLAFAAATGEKGAAVKRVRLAPGEGIAGWVVQRGEPLLVPSPEGDDRWSKRVDELTGFHTQSVVCVPMQLQDRTIGAVELINKIGADHFTDADADLLSTVAAQASLLVENARLLRRFEADKARLRILVETMHRTCHSLGGEELAPYVLSRAAEALQAEGAAVAAADPDTGELVFKVVVGEAARPCRGQRGGKGAGICGWVAQSLEPVFTEDPGGDPRFQPALPCETDEKVASVLALPMAAGGKVYGVMELFNLREGADEGAIAVGCALAGQLALALCAGGTLGAPEPSSG
jgi:GAF domain-containing protein